MVGSELLLTTTGLRWLGGPGFLAPTSALFWVGTFSQSGGGGIDVFSAQTVRWTLVLASLETRKAQGSGGCR